MEVAPGDDSSRGGPEVPAGPPEDTRPPSVDDHPTAKLALVLSATAGYVDAVGYIALAHLFTAHQSGNTAGLGVALSGGDWTEAWHRFTAIGAFVVGVAAGTMIVELERRGRFRFAALVLAATEIAALGGAFATGQIVGPGSVAPYAAVGAAMAGAMGVQTVALRRVGRRSIRTTFVTGVLTVFAETAVAACFSNLREYRSTNVAASRLQAAVWAVYLAGGVTGGLADRSWSFAALAVPIAVVAAVAVRDFRYPYTPQMPSPA